MPMKLKTRLVVAFCIMIFVPVVLAGVVLFGFKNFQMKNLEQTTDWKTGRIIII